MTHIKDIISINELHLIRTKKYAKSGLIEVYCRVKGKRRCSGCGSSRVKSKGVFQRRLKHMLNLGRLIELVLFVHKLKCGDCGRSLRQRAPGIKPRKRATEKFRQEIFALHYAGVSAKDLSKSHSIA